MIRYNRVGLYSPKIKKKKFYLSNNEENSIDWLNMILFVLLIIVLVLFFVA